MTPTFPHFVWVTASRRGPQAAPSVRSADFAALAARRRP
ncbi:hypothetical protein VAR608DRAFT_1186 [Variovorax sp. HW608]|nr:hypothetical protein VAR608DRAFT_1186 [Variovorax sp. HW608]